MAAISALLDRGDYERAEIEATDLRAVLGRTPTARPSDIYRATDLLVEALCRNGKGSRSTTRELAEQVLSGRIAQAGIEDLTLATSLRNLGNVLLQSGEYQTAVQRFKTLVAIRERALGPEHPEVAEDLDHVARALLAADQPDGALTMADRALEIKERTLPVGDVRIARSLDVQGQVLQRKSEHARARTALERAMALQEAATVSAPEKAATLSVLGEQVPGSTAIFSGRRSIAAGHCRSRRVPSGRNIPTLHSIFGGWRCRCMIWGTWPRLENTANARCPWRAPSLDRRIRLSLSR